MTEWSKFDDAEIVAIKGKMNQKFEKAMIITLLWSPIICLIMPYIPGRRGPLIERMLYWDAVIYMSLIWLFAILASWCWNHFKAQKEFLKYRQFLRKKKIVGKLVDKSKGFFASYENILTTDLEDDLKKIEIEKIDSKNFNIGDIIELEFEEHTKTILTITKLKASNK